MRPSRSRSLSTWALICLCGFGERNKSSSTVSGWLFLEYRYPQPASSWRPRSSRSSLLRNPCRCDACTSLQRQRQTKATVTSPHGERFSNKRSKVTVSSSSTGLSEQDLFSMDDDDDDNHHPQSSRERSLPFEQRVVQSRPARRMNHPFKYLYRHDFVPSSDNDAESSSSSNNNSTLLDANDDDRNGDDALAYLVRHGGYTIEQVLEMNRTFPVLLQLSTRQQLHPKLQFLKHTLGQANPSAATTNTTRRLPPFYFGSRLERIVAPRHAFLVWAGLPSGAMLFMDKQDVVMNATATIETTSSRQQQSGRRQRSPPSTQCLFQDFMMTCRNSKQFAAMCQSWYHDYGLVCDDAASLDSHSSTTDTNDAIGAGAAHLFYNGRSITAKDVEAFDAMFSRGLLSAVRNDLVQPGNTWPIEQLPTLVACHLVQLLIRHGANPQARDYRGATLLHWACGTGHWAAAKVLLSCRDCNHHGHNGDDEVDVGMNNDKSNHATMATAVATRDGATPLHWAAAGTNTREFGVGGHVEVCRNLLEHVRQIHQERQQQNVPNHTISVLDYVNQATYDGNSALMWAAWSGTLDTVKLLVRNRADASIQNRNGCTVAHWAASGGNLAVCQYLYNVAHVDFGRPNFGGNTPLTHAVAFGRTSVVSWLMDILPRDDKDEMVLEGSSGFRDSQAYRLAHDFVHWTDGQDSQRRKVLQLFDEELYGLPSASDS